MDHIEKCTSGNSQHCTTSCTISFRDTRATAEKEFELHHHTNLPKSVSKCQGNCGRPIKVEEVMVVRSYGRITWTDKSTGKEKAKFGPMYIHFHEHCVINFSDTFILCPQPIICFFKNKNWSKVKRKAYRSRRNIAVVIGNKLKFQKTIFYSAWVYYQIFYENNHVDLPFLVNVG